MSPGMWKKKGKRKAPRRYTNIPMDSHISSFISGFLCESASPGMCVA